MKFRGHVLLEYQLAGGYCSVTSICLPLSVLHLASPKQLGGGGGAQRAEKEGCLFLYPRESKQTGNRRTRTETNEASSSCLSALVLTVL